ncbi:MAG: hypothetical protein K6L73_04500 [Cellvibrionaceae bacterium]
MLRLFIFSITSILSFQLWAACSPYMGQASINEVSKFRSNGANNAEDLVEVKILDDSIPQAVINAWEIRICENSGDGCTGYISLGSFDNASPPWMVLKGNPTPADYISFDDGFDIIFRDQNGLTIDYLTYDGHEPQKDNNCFAELPFDTASGKSGSGEKRIRREPDGTGDWDFVTSQSTGDTEDTTNDDVAAGVPDVSIDDATASPGSNATFTVSLDAAYTQDVVLTYSTVDVSAVAGSDYTATTGTVTISAGSTTATFDIPTLAGGSGIFNVFIGLDDTAPNFPNAIIVDQTGQGVILGSLIAEWQMDENGWGGAGTILDATGNGYNGTPVNAVSNEGTSPGFTDSARTGDPGTCYFGDMGNYSFLGSNNQRILIPDDFGGAASPFTELTLSAWVNPENTLFNSNDDHIFRKGGEFDLVITKDPSFFSQGDFLEFRWQDGSETFTSTSRLTMGVWSHVAVVFRAGEQRIYINGVLNATGTNTQPLQNDATSLYLGSHETTDLEKLFGSLDEVRIYDVALPEGAIQDIYNETRPCGASGIDHYAITFSGTPLTCQPLSITVTAVDTNGDPYIVPSDTTFNIDTTPNVTSTPAQGTIASGDSSVTFSISQTTAGEVDIDVDDGTYTDPDDGGVEDERPIFVDTALRFVEFGASGFSTDISTQISAKPSPVNAPGALYLEAVRTDSNSLECTSAWPAASSVDVALGAYCHTPSSCAGVSVSLNGTVSTVDAGSALSYSAPQSFNTDGNGRIPLTFTYNDAGRMVLNARYEVLDDSGSGTGEYLTGSSENFVVMPAGLCVEATEANSDCTALPPATIAECSVFKKAGEGFTLNVAAKGWVVDGESNTEFCDNPITTPNFQIAGIALASAAVSPTANNAVLGATAYSITGNGNVDVTQTVDNVGIFTIASGAIENYLGEATADIAASSSAAIGRFTPDRFSVTDGEIRRSTGEVGSLFYLDEPFTIQANINALNTSGLPTSNYVGDFAKLTDSDGTISVGATDGSIDYMSRITPGVRSITWTNGVGALSLPAEFDRAATVDGPFLSIDIGIAPQDTDLVNANSSFDLNTNPAVDAVNDHVLIGSSDFYYARAIVEDRHGPESTALSVPFLIEYWDGSRYVTAPDSHTHIQQQDIYFSDDISNVYVAGNRLSVDFNAELNPGGETSTATVCGTCIDGTDITFDNGDAGLSFTAPSAQGEFYIGLDLDDYPWLQFDWDNDGTDDQFAPTATIKFETYRGHDRVIYWRERF